MPDATALVDQRYDHIVVGLVARYEAAGGDQMVSAAGPIVASGGGRGHGAGGSQSEGGEVAAGVGAGRGHGGAVEHGAGDVQVEGGGRTN